MITAENVWSRVDRRSPDECWPWLGGTSGSGGRGRVTWRGREQYAYRVTWELANGVEFPEGMLARHSCDNPVCVNPGHIEPGTQLDNMRDASERGRIRTTPRYGTDHHAVTVRPELVAQAVDEYLSGTERQADIAARYGVTQTTLSLWVRGKVRQDAGQGMRERGRPFKPCGTHAAHERHKRRGEQPCDPCVVAERDYWAEHRRRKRGT